MLFHPSKGLTVLIACFLLFGCGPGAKDGSVHISDGYYFTHLGGNQNIIEFKDGDQYKAVIKASVDQFLFDDGKIFVSRLPLTYYREGNVTKQKMGNECEYWLIKIAEHEILGPLSAKEITTMTAVKAHSSTGGKCPLSP